MKGLQKYLLRNNRCFDKDMKDNYVLLEDKRFIEQKELKQKGYSIFYYATVLTNRSIAFQRNFVL